MTELDELLILGRERQTHLGDLRLAAGISENLHDVTESSAKGVHEGRVPVLVLSVQVRARREQDLNKNI